MAYTKKSKKEKIEKPNYGVLDSLTNVEVNSAVRFRLKDAATWTQGNVLGENKDGSLTLIDSTGKLRAIMPQNIQVKTKGPRGGVIWTELEDGV